MRNNPISIVLQGDDDMDSDILTSFEKVADKLYDFLPFVYASTDVAAYQFGLQPDQDSSVTSSIILRRQIDDTFLTYDRESLIDKPDSFEEFVRNNLKPMYRTSDGTVFRDIIHDPRWTLFCFLDTSKKSGMKPVHSGFREVIEKYGYNFTYVYANIRDYIPLLNSIGIAGKNDPVWLFANFTDDGEIGDKVSLPEGTELQPGLLIRFTEQVLQAYDLIPIKSEPIPDKDDENNEENLIKKLVGKTFKNVFINNHNKIILVIEGNNTKSAAAYNSLYAIAEEFDKQGCKTVSFYYIDKTKNDIPVQLDDDVSIILAKKNGQNGLLPFEKDPVKFMKLIVQELNPVPKVKVPKKIVVTEIMKPEAEPTIEDL